MTDAREVIAKWELTMRIECKECDNRFEQDELLGHRTADAIIAALAAAGLTIVSEEQFVEVACMLYCLGATDRVAGRPQNAVPASKQAWRELRAMVEAASDE